MIPYKDLNPTRHLPVVTFTLVVTNVLVFVYQTMEPEFSLIFAAVPEQIFGVFQHRQSWPLVTLLTSAFLHGDILHIAFNMLFLWVFGDNVEDRLGHGRFLGFYLTAAVIAALCHVIVAPASAVPMVGASGAISAVLGAYLLFFPSARVRALFIIIIFPKVLEMPALLYLGLWFLLQILSSLTGNPDVPGVAWFAHIGGFLFGFLFALGVGRQGRRR